MSHTTSRPLTLSYENALYLLAFATGLFARLFQLGAAPLGDGEAQAALQALAMARGAFETVSITSIQPFYTALTGLAFFLVKDSNILARIVPALTGSLLVLLPFTILKIFPQIKGIGRWAGIILTFALALDPGFVLLSRSAGSSMPGVFFTVLGLAGLAVTSLSPAHARTGALLAGAAFGAALLSGPALWIGIFILVMALLVSAALIPVFSLSHVFGSLNRRLSGHLAAILTAALVTITALVIGVPVVLGSPLDLSGLGGSLAGFASSIVKPSGVPAVRVLAALFIYHPLAMVFGLSAAFRFLVLAPINASPAEETNPLAPLLTLWFFTALLVTLIFPGREMAGLIWVLIPIWILAAIQLSDAAEDWLSAPPGQLLTAGSVYAFLLFMLVINLLNLTNLWPDLLARFQLAGALAQVAVITAGMGLMLVIVSALFWLYWSPRLMQSALSLSAALLLSLALGGAAWSLSLLRPDSTVELWRASPNRYAAPGQLEELYQTLRQAAVFGTGLQPASASGGGVRTDMEVVLIDPLASSPSLKWVLRSFSTRSAAALNANDTTGAVLTLEQAGLSDNSQPDPTTSRLNSSYRGQDLTWQSTPAWNGALPPGFFAWLFERKAPETRQKLIVWVRGDIFPGGTTTP